MELRLFRAKEWLPSFPLQPILDAVTSFRFLHAADLHLGSPFRGLALKDAEVARRFSAATRNAFTALIDRALEDAVDFVVIAGDVYDREWKDSAIGLFFNREIARLDRAAIPVFVLKGNHDADSVVTKSVTLPDSVRQFSTKKPETFRLDGLRVALHGQGFSDRAATDNLALAYPTPVPGWFNIGVLHTSLSGRPPHANYAPCTVDELRSRGYDYWALGHAHDFEVVAENPPMVFPGNLQGRSIRETGGKGAVLVTVTDGEVALERVLVDQARWHAASLVADGADSLAELLELARPLLREVANAGAGKLLALRLTLRGETPMAASFHANRQQLTDELQAAAQRVHADIWLEKLDLHFTSPRDAVTRPASAIDLDSLVAAALADPAIAATAATLIRDVTAKLPGGLGADTGLGDDLDQLLAEARDVVLQRAGGTH
ncbi:MAG: repair exonuclease [Devosia sp.]|nr:repair exonuclease [Devosia sp.]